jgi:sugar phosphate isomerase/epimerase
LKHGVIGHGLNNYDKIFTILRGIGFAVWVSIEDGADPETSIDVIRELAIFLRKKWR